MVEPLRDEVVQEFGVDQVPVIQIEAPEGEDHKLHQKKQVSKAARARARAHTHTHTHSPLPQGRPAPPSSSPSGRPASSAGAPALCCRRSSSAGWRRRSGHTGRRTRPGSPVTAQPGVSQSGSPVTPPLHACQILCFYFERDASTMLIKINQL